MDLKSILHRNQVLHSYFEGRNWHENDEFTLKRELVLNRYILLPEHRYIIEDEWDVIDSRTDLGRGDLVFTDGTGCFAVVEVKWIDLDSGSRAGTTKRTSNRKKRRKVEEQAIEYANKYRAKLSDSEFVFVKSIEAFYFTNEANKPISIEQNRLINSEGYDLEKDNDYCHDDWWDDIAPNYYPGENDD
jgi:hypothetical protein